MRPQYRVVHQVTDYWLLITDYLKERRRSKRWPSWPVVGIERVLLSCILLSRVLLLGSAILLLIRLLIDWRSYRGGRVVRRILRRVFRFFRVRPVMSYMGWRLWPHKEILKCLKWTCTRRLRQHTCS